MDNVKVELGEEKNPQEGSTSPSESDKDIIKLAMKRATQWTEYHTDNISAAKENNEFIVEGEQWPAKVKKAREDDGLPCLTFNRAPGFIGRHVGKMLRNLPRAKAVGIDSKSDPELGRIVTELGRKVRRQSRAPRIYGSIIKQVMTSGFIGWRRIVTDYVDDGSFEQEIYIQGIPYQFSVMLDPSATSLDTPARGGPKWGMVCEDIPAAEFARRYPKAHAKGIDSDETGGESWMKDDEIRIAEYYYAEPYQVKILQFNLNGKMVSVEEGTEKHSALTAQFPGIQSNKERTSERYKIMRCIISGFEILEKAEEWPGKYIPIIPCFPKSAWVNGKQKFEGLYQWAKDAGRMRNYWASALTSNVALSEAPPYIATTKQIEANKGQWANPKGLRVITYTPDPGSPQSKPSREQPSVISQGEVTMIQLAIDEEKALCSTYDASLGNRSNETSGIAIQARDSQSEDSQFEFEDNLAASIEYEEMQLIDLYPKVYDTHRIFRIYGDDGKDAGTVEVNRPSGEMVQDDTTGQLVEKLLNDLSIMRYDVEVQVGPGPASKRGETAEVLSRMAQVAPNTAPFVIPYVAKSLDFEYADELSEVLEASLPPEIKAIIEGKRNKGNSPEAAKLQQVQQQAQQAVEQIKQQSMQAFQAAEQKINELEQKLQQATQAMNDKGFELQLKQQELEVKAQTEAVKAQASVRVAEIEAQTAIAQAEVEASKPQMSMKQGGGCGCGGHSENEMQPSTTKKTMVMRTPEGREYIGEVIEEVTLEPHQVETMKPVKRRSINVVTPEGENYQGAVHEQPMMGDE